jgi:hypothetical protein
VAGPAVRLVVTGGGHAQLAWTSFDGARFSVKVMALDARHRGTPQTLSPAEQDAVLGDVAAQPNDAASDGPVVVLWRSNVRGSTTAQGQTAQVFADGRLRGAPTFGAPEAVSEAGQDVPFAPTALVMPGSPVALALFSHLQPGTGEIAVRTSAYQ